MRTTVPVHVLSAALLTLMAQSCSPAPERGEQDPIERKAQALGATAGPLARGFIATRVGKAKIGNGPEEIFLPRVAVHLRNARDQSEGAPTLTDLSGRFTARAPAAGRYHVCWKAAGFVSGCSTASFNLSRGLTNVGTFHIALVPAEGRTAIYGRASLANGASARFLDPLANVNAFITIALLDQRTGRRLAEVPVNNQDLFVIPEAPNKTTLLLHAQDNGYEHKQPVELLGTAAQERIDVVLLNHAPVIEPLAALDRAGVRVVAVNGLAVTTVTLNARVSDKDGDKVKYLWRVSSGALSAADAAAPSWTLPRVSGDHAATLLVSDGRGGYDTASLSIAVDRNGLEFSGRVSATDAAAVAGAEVSVNGRTVVTDGTGYFRVKVPDRKRFVVNVHKRGYALASSIHYDGVVGGQWRLTRAETYSADPTVPINLTHVRSKRECPGPESVKLDWKGHPTLAIPQYQDGDGNVVPLPKGASKLPGLPSVDPRQEESRGCGPGIRVAIPANGLVDANGLPPTGKVDIQLSTVDLATPDQMPGDYTVIDGAGQAKAAQSWGAGTVEIFAGATRYNLRPGVKAQLVIPVDPTQLRAGGPFPPDIPLLHFDEARGVWREEGKAILQNLAGVPAYVGEVTHFSAYNMDLIKTNQACLIIQNSSMPATYNLEVTVPQGAGVAPYTVMKGPVAGNNEETVLLNLPTGTNIVLVPIRISTNLPIGVFVVNTGAPQNPAWPIVSGGFANEPQAPYSQRDPVTNAVTSAACSTRVVLTDGVLSFPAGPLTGAFLHGLGSFGAVNLSDTDPHHVEEATGTLRADVEAASQAYRARIDPRGLRPTLSCWKATNGFPLEAGETCAAHGTIFSPPAVLPETTAVYANSTDLGFGREMHCVQSGTTRVACYVSNYDSLVYTGPTRAGDESKAQKAVEGFQNTRLPDATVAMEWSPLEEELPAGSPAATTPVTINPGGPTVKFYVFNQLGNPVDKANLDQLGDRPVPQLCMVCHGGFVNQDGPTPPPGVAVAPPLFDDPDDVRLGARFLPFDLASFSYAQPDPAPGDPVPPFSKKGQQAAFRTLNAMVQVALDPLDPGVVSYQELSAAWYPAVGDQVEAAVVAPWRPPLADPLRETGYRNVVAPSCRTCHIANFDPNYMFATPSSFDGLLGTVQTAVCRDHIMPHARRTHDLFWTSVGPSQPAVLQAYGDTLAPTGGWQQVAVAGQASLICGQEYTVGGGVTTPPTTPFTPVAVVLGVNCTGCHRPDNKRGGLDLTTYGSFVNVPSSQGLSYVQSGVATELTSYVWRKISNTHGSLSPPGGGTPMPPSAPNGLLNDPAHAAEAEVIRTWIQGGAQP
jgi:hypothetical protein